MIDYLTQTQQRLWDIFRGTVPNWSTMVRPGNEISFITGPIVPSKLMMGAKQPADYPEFSICPTGFSDQGYQSQMAKTFAVAHGLPGPFITDEAVPYELKLVFADLRYDKAAPLLIAMKSALYAAGPRLALVAPASPTATALPYVKGWGGWSGTFKPESREGGGLRLVVRTSLTVNYRFSNADFGL